MPDNSEYVRLQHDHDALVVRNTRIVLEIRTAKRELEEMANRLAKVSAGYKEAKNENKEIRKVLEQADGYKRIEQTVVALTSMLVSKRNEHLTI
jgi:hypothetical protein